MMSVRLPSSLRGSIIAGTMLLGSCARTPPAPVAPAPASTWDIEQAQWVDLTHVFDHTTVYWPTAPSGFRLESLHHGPTEAGYFYSANVISAPEHGGTHLDAPIHFAQGGATTDQVPLERLVAPAVVVDITAAARADRDARLAVADIEAFEAAHGAITPGTIVLVRTGWSERWPDASRYLGAQTPGDATTLHFPGISRTAAEALVQRRVASVGIDTASIDHGPSQDFVAHQVLMGADIPAFENLTGLDRLPPRGALVVALPMKIGGGSGGPLRVVAALPPAAEPAPAPSPTDPTTGPTAGPATGSADPLGPVIAAVLDSRPMVMYLHPEISGRVPVVIAGPALAGHRVQARAQGAPVVPRADATAGPEDPVVVFERIAITDAVAEVELRYPIEGIAGRFVLARHGEGWTVTKAELAEQ